MCFAWNKMKLSFKWHLNPEILRPALVNGPLFCGMTKLFQKTIGVMSFWQLFFPVFWNKLQICACWHNLTIRSFMQWSLLWSQSFLFSLLLTLFHSTRLWGLIIWPEVSDRLQSDSVEYLRIIDTAPCSRVCFSRIVRSISGRVGIAGFLAFRIICKKQQRRFLMVFYFRRSICYSPNKSNWTWICIAVLRNKIIMGLIRLQL